MKERDIRKIYPGGKIEYYVDDRCVIHCVVVRTPDGKEHIMDY